MKSILAISLSIALIFSTFNSFATTTGFGGGETETSLKIVLNVHGKGGVVVDEDSGTQKVCPETSTAHCANIVIHESVASGEFISGPIRATLILESGSSKDILLTIPDLPVSETDESIVVQGGNLSFE
ncbi:MAG: hypothetical protein AAFO96_19660 [Bacteroidota bacterium]